MKFVLVVLVALLSCSTVTRQEQGSIAKQVQLMQSICDDLDESKKQACLDGFNNIIESEVLKDRALEQSIKQSEATTEKAGKWDGMIVTIWILIGIAGAYSIFKLKSAFPLL